MTPVKTHNENRQLVCLICFKKGSRMLRITDKELGRIRKYFMEDFDPMNEKLPNGTCSRCRLLLYRIENGKPCVIDKGVDYSMLRFPAMTRFRGMGRVLGQITNCPCSICVIARDHPGYENSTYRGYPGTGKARSYTLGRPPKIKRKRSVSAESVKVCQRCKKMIGKGIRHSQPCKPQQQNLQNVIENDPLEVERLASEVIKKKIADSGRSKTIQIASCRKNKVLTLPKPPSKTSTSLYKYEKIPATELNNLRLKNNLTQKQILRTAQVIRSWKG